MSQLTLKFFRKLHSCLMIDETYKKAYEHAMQLAIWHTMTMDMLMDMVKVYSQLSVKGDRHAAGMANALREIMWQRMYRGRIA